jgi:hypothetical protein
LRHFDPAIARVLCKKTWNDCVIKEQWYEKRARFWAKQSAFAMMFNRFVNRADYKFLVMADQNTITLPLKNGNVLFHSFRYDLPLKGNEAYADCSCYLGICESFSNFLIRRGVGKCIICKSD